MSYNIFRWYRAGAGRYTQADPIELEGGLNLYGYVSGNPLRYTDALGLLCGAGWGDWVIPDKAWMPAWDHSGPCQNHDQCYGTCGMPKSSCDEMFKKQMNQNCAKVSKVYYAACKIAAAVYAQAVETFGKGPYENAQKEACKQCYPPKKPQQGPFPWEVWDVGEPL